MRIDLRRAPQPPDSFQLGDVVSFDLFAGKRYRVVAVEHDALGRVTAFSVDQPHSEPPVLWQPERSA